MATAPSSLCLFLFLYIFRVFLFFVFVYFGDEHAHGDFRSLSFNTSPNSSHTHRRHRKAANDPLFYRDCSSGHLRERRTVIQPTEAISNNERPTFWDANDRVSEQIQFRRFLFFSFVLLYVSAELSIRSVRLLFVCVCRARGGRMNFVIVDVVRHSFRCRLSKMGNALKCCPVGNG